MIPIKLTLRNFMCYKETPPISFESIHTACISGDNGNGKSALIDAITWALWGETRANTDDDLIHSGQFEAQVDFEFEVDKQRYRVIRRRTKAKSQKTPGKTILELQAITGEGNKPLTAENITYTEAKIKNILHMDYQTFINSAFLRQGHADEFSTKRPGERKQVLGNILQLSVYEDLKEITKELARKQEGSVRLLETELEAIQGELVQKPSCLAELEKAQALLSQAETTMAQAKQRLDGLHKDQIEMDGRKRQLAELEVHLKESELNLKLWNEQAAKHHNHISEYQGLIDTRVIIENNFGKLTEVRKLCREYEQKFKQFRTLDQSKNRLAMVIMRATDILTGEHAATERRLTELENSWSNQRDLEKAMAQLEEQLKNWESEESKIQQKRAESKVLQGRILFLQAEKPRLRQEKEQTEEKLKLLSHPDGFCCPLCETELGAEGQKRIETKYRAALFSLTEALNANERELTSKTTESKTVDWQISQSEEAVKQGKAAAQKKAGNLGKALADSKEAEKKSITEKLHLDEIEQKLASRDFAGSEQLGLLEVETQLAALSYDSAEHERLTGQLAEAERYEEPKRRLEEADRLISQEAEAEKQAATTAGEIAAKLAIDSVRRKSLTSDVANSSEITTRLNLVEKEYQYLQAEEKTLRGQIGGIQARLERLDQLEKRQKEKQSQMSQNLKEEKIYQDLIQAYGKDGIQAMLVEMAIPEIEIEANKLLALMTDGKMHVKLESQKETQKGDVVETLDINITDELGTRKYEMFSGGEAFRIDFAVRIALSRLLAHRAGAPLSTLIIDEGFGTQDSNGIEKIKEAITSIQDDFEKILVITHIADFKDAFPTRIEVVKTADGSSVFLN
jgi:exonuclease SbcC